MSIFNQSICTENSGMSAGTTYYDVEDLYQAFKERMLREMTVGYTLADLEAELADATPAVAAKLGTANEP